MRCGGVARGCGIKTRRKTRLARPFHSTENSLLIITHETGTIPLENTQAHCENEGEHLFRGFPYRRGSFDAGTGGGFFSISWYSELVTLL